MHNKSTACGTQCSSVRNHHSTLNVYIKKGHNSKTIAFSFMSLVLQQHLKYSKFGVDTLSNFSVMGYIKVFARRRSSAITRGRFSSKQTSKKMCSSLVTH